MQCLRARADVAQLVEQRFRKPQVTGSNPVVGSLLSQKHFTNENHREFHLNHCSNLERGGKYRAAGFGNYGVRCSFSGNFVR